KQHGAKQQLPCQVAKSSFAGQRSSLTQKPFYPITVNIGGPMVVLFAVNLKDCMSKKPGIRQIYPKRLVRLPEDLLRPLLQNLTCLNPRLPGLKILAFRFSLHCRSAPG